MREEGFIHDVRVVIAGSDVAADANVGETVVFVGDAADFNEDGGNVILGDDLLVAYVSADMDEDSITLAEPLPITIYEGEGATVYPLTQEKYAVVVLDDFDESISARLPHSFYPLVPEGIREEGLREAAVIENINGSWEVVDVPGKEASFDGTFIENSTIYLSSLNDEVRNQLGNGFTITKGADEPVDPEIGDYWIDESEGNKFKYWNGTSWEDVSDASIAAALQAATDAADLADSKVRIFYTTPDGSQDEGDLWFDAANGNLPKRWNGSAWVDVEIGLEALGPDVTARNLGAITTSIGSSAPSSPKVGDIWVDTGNFYAMKRWDGSDWTEITDERIQEAIDEALAAANVADSKMRIFYQDGEPTGLNNTTDVGDLWFDTTDNANVPHRWSGTAWVEIRDGGIQEAIDKANEALANTGPDGEPPVFSPTPHASGGIGSLFIQWNPITNHDPVEYEVHVSEEQDFDPNVTTLVVTTTGTTANVRELTGGAAVEYGKTYYVVIIAKDVDGSADPSNEASATPRQATNEDISANFVYAGEISVNNLTGGTLTADINLASAIKTANAGARVEMNAEGIIVYRSDNTPTTVLESTGESTFKGNVEAEGMTVKGGATFRSDENEITQSAALNLASAITQSKQAPTAVWDWAKTPLLDPSGNPWPTPGTLVGLTRVPDGKWIAADSAQPRIWYWNADGSYHDSTTLENIVSGVAKPVTNGPAYGLRVSGADCFVERLEEWTTWQDSFASMSNWTTTGSVSAVSGEANLTAAQGQTAQMTRSVNMLTNAVSSKMVLPTGRSTTQEYGMRVDSTSLTGHMRVVGQFLTMSTGSGTSSNITYDPVAHRFWRIRENNGRFYFETAQDGQEWTTRYNAAHGLSSAQLQSMTWTIYVTHSVDGPNLLSNGTFESGISPWVGRDGGTWLRSTAYKHSGNYALRTPNTYHEYAERKVFVEIPTIVGRAYEFSVWARRHKNPGDPLSQISNVRLWARTSAPGIYDWPTPYDPDATPYFPQENIFHTTTWKQTKLTYVATSTKTYFVILAEPGDYTNPLYFDDVVIKEEPEDASPITLKVDDAKHIQAKASVPFVRQNSHTPVLTAYSGNLIVAEFRPTPKVFRFSTVNPSTLATASAWESAATTGFTGPLRGVVRTTADVGYDAYWVNDVSATNGQNWYPIRVSDGAVVSADRFSTIGESRGIGWNGSNFYTLGTNGALHKHEGIGMTWTTETDFKAGFTWSNGSYETPISALAYFAPKRRARLTITSSALPSAGSGVSPNRIKVYVGRGAEGIHYQAASSTGTNSATLTSINWSGEEPPLVANFPDSVPAEIRSTNGALVIDANGDITARSISIIPPGSVEMYAGTSVPTGWLLCDGQAVSRPVSEGGANDDYKKLWEAIGTAYGTGDGSTTFNVPNFTDRFPRGTTPGATGGSDTANVPAHSHGAGSLSTGNPTSTYNRGAGSNATASDVHKHDITGSTANGGAANIDIVPRFLGINFIIKI